MRARKAGNAIMMDLARRMAAIIGSFPRPVKPAVQDGALPPRSNRMLAAIG
jgi:hypothetical protein